MLYFLAVVKVKGKHAAHIFETTGYAPSGTSDIEIREHILTKSAGGGNEWEDDLKSQMTANGHTEVVGTGGITHTILSLHQLTLFNGRVNDIKTKILLPHNIDSLLKAQPIASKEGMNPYFITMIWDESGHDIELNNIVWAKDIEAAKREALLLECHPAHRDEVVASEAIKSFAAHDGFSSIRVEKADVLRVANIHLTDLEEGNNQMDVYLFNEPLEYLRGIRPLLPFQCRPSPYKA
ncbi:MAG: hypothetical protein J6N72_09455 [Psychrobacter sp.]|nr:hypothetical protein [Psychrobacter sp.]